MLSRSEIQKRQNKEGLLKYQYAARYSYNRAEMWTAALMFCCLASVATSFLPISDNQALLFIPLLLNVGVWLFRKLIDKNIQSGAMLRNYYDYKVLNIKTHTYKTDEILRINEITDRIVTKNTEECHVQITHTGRDEPNGVLDWYELNNMISDKDAVFECQRQNCWWNNKLMRWRLVIYSIIGLLMLGGSLFSILCLTPNSATFKAVIFIITLFLVIIDPLIHNAKYVTLSLKIDANVTMMNKSKDEKQIQHLQTLIEERRKLPVVEINWIHKKKSKKYSELYQRISGEKQ